VHFIIIRTFIPKPSPIIASFVEEREKREPGHCWCSDCDDRPAANDAKRPVLVRVVSSIVQSKSIKRGKEPSKTEKKANRRKQTTWEAMESKQEKADNKRSRQQEKTNGSRQQEK